MRRTALLAILLFFVMAAKPSQTVTTQPIEVYVVIPAGYPAYADFSQAGPEVASWMAEIEAWVFRETGKHFNYTVTTLYSTHTIYEMSNGLDGCAFAPIPEGQGFGPNWNTFMSVVYNEFNIPDFGTERHLFVGVGGGGHTEGNYFGGGQTNFGRVLVGDWGLYEQLVGVHDPCNPYNAAPCDPRGLNGAPTPCIGGIDSNPCGTLGHEMLHAFNVDSHNPVVGCGDTLSTQQKRDLTRNGKPFFY